MTSNWSNGPVALLTIIATLVGVFALPTVPARGQEESATITIQPETAPQNSTITMTLSGFLPDEEVTIWQTLPDLSVNALGNIEVDNAGGATVSLFVSSANPTGTHAFSARGNTSLREATAYLELTLGEGAAPSSRIQILVRAEIGPQGSTFTFTGNGYQPDEEVAIWINLPNDTVQGLGRVRTDVEGTFELTLSLGSSYPEGVYELTAFGLKSKLTGITPFELVRGGADVVERPVSTLIVTPPQVQQFDVISVTGNNFGADETVSLWVTLNNGSVLPIGRTGTADDGSFVFQYEIDGRRFPAGVHEITAQGNESGLSAITTFEVLPGSPE